MKYGILMLLLILALGPIVLGETVSEPKTNVPFTVTTELDGKTLDLAGVGLRTKLMVKVYAAGLYLDPAARTELDRFKSQLSKPNASVFESIIHSGYDKLFVLHFVRDVGSGRIRDAFKEGLEKSMDVEAPDVRADVQSFLSSFKTDLKKGEELKLFVEGQQVTVISPAGDRTVIKNPKIAWGTTACWLGKDGVQEDLKKGLVSRLPELVK
jgi:Chalcone isomerase-like